MSDSMSKKSEIEIIDSPMVNDDPSSLLENVIKSTGSANTIGKNDEEEKSSSQRNDKQIDDTNKEQGVVRSQNDVTERDVQCKNDEEEKSSSQRNDKQIDDTNKEQGVVKSQNDVTDRDVQLLLIKRRGGKTGTSNSSNRKRGRLQDDKRPEIWCRLKIPKENRKITDLTKDSEAKEGACEVIDLRD